MCRVRGTHQHHLFSRRTCSPRKYDDFWQNHGEQVRRLNGGEKCAIIVVRFTHPTNWAREKNIMPLYPLGITRSRDVPPKVDEGSVALTDVRWSRVGELACAFIDAPHEGFQPQRHALALDAIHRRTCVLPVRFGVEVRDEGEIHALLQAHGRELLDRLEKLAGACEMGLRITLANSVPLLACKQCPTVAGYLGTACKQAVAHDKPLSPPAYLAQRRSHYRQTDAATQRERHVVGQLLGRLQGEYRDWRKLPATPAHLIRLTFLVERERADAFRSRTEEFARAWRAGRCVVLGPWPPYSFV